MQQYNFLNSSFINAIDETVAWQRTSSAQHCNDSHHAHHMQNSRVATFSAQIQIPHPLLELHWPPLLPFSNRMLRSSKGLVASIHCEELCCRLLVDHTWTLQPPHYHHIKNFKIKNEVIAYDMGSHWAREI